MRVLSFATPVGHYPKPTVVGRAVIFSYQSTAPLKLDSLPFSIVPGRLDKG